MSDKYISRDNLELAIDGLKVGMTPNWNENDKSVIGYIENRPFYTEYGVIVDNYSGSGKRPKCNFVVGNTYDVIWNGVTYKGLVCRTDGGYNFIGGDGYPFYIDNDGGNGFYVEPESGFTVSILGDIVHQLDEKYIPDDIARVEDVEDELNSLADDFNENISNLETDVNSDINRLDVNINTLRYIMGGLKEDISTNTLSISNNANAIKEKMEYKKISAPFEAGYIGNICYGNDMFVVVNMSSDQSTFTVAYSADCINWNTSVMPSGYRYTISNLVYGNGKFAITAYHTASSTFAVFYSIDGIRWTNANAPSVGTLIEYCGDRFIICGSNAAYSLDCINWTQITLPYSNTWTDIAYGDGKFIGISVHGSNMGVYQSEDGINWTRVTTLTERRSSIIYYNNKFILYNSVDGRIGCSYSEDGMNWTSADNNSFTYMVSNGNKLLASNGYDYFYSIDGLNWTAASEKPNFSCHGLTYADGRFMTANQSSPYEIFYSMDGIVWKQDGHITQNNENITNEVRDLILPISTTAQVGQLLSVKSVDENGKPTEWEAVDMPSGGSTPVEYDAIILRSSTEGSSKKFRLTIGDDGVLMAEEV